MPRGPRRLVLPALLCAVVASGHAAAADDCDEWNASFVLISGRVEVLPNGSSEWRQAELGGRACRGDTVRTGPFATAGLRLPDKTIFRLDQNTQVQLPEPPERDGTLVRLLRGIIHIVSRNPRELTFATPFMNAGLEGTEFVIGVDPDSASADVTVLEGVVAVDGGGRQIEVLPGQHSQAAPGRPPVAEPVADPFAATRWTPWSARILLADDDPDSSADSAEELVRRAAGRIRHGGFEAAADDLARAEQLESLHPAIPVLRAMIALSRGDKSQADRWATEATTANPSYAPAHLARSYVAQALFDYAAALDHARDAYGLAPMSAVTIVRLAEVQLAIGAHRAAADGAERALSVEPAYAQGHTVLGFAELDNAEIEAAIASFATAIRLDPSSPLPHIGQALALLRNGETVAGRDELEIAVILDPTNAAVRSVMAKAYAAEGRLQLAESQLDLASSLDAADPTPELYRALIEERASRPVAALEAYERAAALNDDDPTFRTRLRVDRDTAVRDFGFSHLYRDLGFGHWALNRGWLATSVDPTNHSGHRLLGDSYARLPRHEAARVNEHYQARLLQPLTQVPIAPELGEPSLYLIDDLGPGDLTTSEFGGLVMRNGLHLQASAVGAGIGTHGYNIALTELGNRIAYGAGRFDFSTAGFRPNNDLSHDVTNAFVQFQPKPEASYLAELRHSQSDQGDLQLLFDPERYSPTLRYRESIDSIRLGMRRDLSTGVLLLSTNIATTATDISTGPAYSSTGDSDSTSFEAQHILDTGRWQLTSGIYGLDQTDTIRSSLAFGPPGSDPLTTISRIDSTELSVYLYGRVYATSRLSVLIGAAADRIRLRGATSSSEVNPKVGLAFDLTDRTSLRASVTDSTQGRIFARRSIQPRLEPTHVFGFNQLYTGTAGEQARRTGVAMDHRIADRMLTGIELSKRDVEFETLQQFRDGGIVATVSQRTEDSAQAFAEWIISESLSVSAAYRRDRFALTGQSLPESFAELDTRAVPFEVNYFTGFGLHARARFSLIRQSGLFSPFTPDPNPPLQPGRDRFSLLDLGVSYDLPGHRGQVALTIDNALDERFRFQDIDPENPNVIAERVVALRFTIAQ